MKKILQSLFAFFDNNGSRRNVSTPRSRVLRCEALEDRSLLSATAFDASSALSCAILDTDATLFVEDVEVADGAPEDAPLVIPECVLSAADSECDAIQLDTVQFLDNIDIVYDADGMGKTSLGTRWGNATRWSRTDSTQRLSVGYKFGVTSAHRT